MVYEKKQSGDPDYDDKQPPEFHSGGPVVSAGDGVRISPVTGPVNAEGAHVNLAVDENDLDNRPAPGETAEKASEVQQYDVKDTPVYQEATDADRADIDAIKEGQKSVRANSEAQGQTDVHVATDDDKTPAKKAAPAKSTGNASK